MEHYLGVAEAEGVTPAEIDAVQAVVMSVSACRVRSQLSRVAKAEQRTSPGDEPGPEPP